VLKVIIVGWKFVPGIEWWIDVDELKFTGEVWQECFQSKKILTLHQEVASGWGKWFALLIATALDLN
jgi:hypothetical protein